MKKLTVAIPTYNRNDILNNTLSLLLPQITSEVCILILDNGSDIPVSQSLLPLLPNKEIDIRVIRNKVNLGVSANVMKCFEFCETEWMWLLGDDDAPLANAVETILNDTDLLPNVSFINYYCSGLGFVRKVPEIVKGLNSFLDKLDNFSTLLFMSNGIYKIKDFSKFLRWGYQYANTFCPHMAMILKVIDDGNLASLQMQEIVCFKEPEIDQKWSWLSLSSNITSLLQIPLNISKKSFFVLSEHIYTHVLLDYDYYVNLKYSNKRSHEYQYSLAYICHLYFNTTFLRKRSLVSRITNFLFYRSFESPMAFNLLHAVKGNYLTSLEKAIRHGSSDRL